MKSKRNAPFIYGSIPHSVLRRAREIKNPTASSVLLYLASRTFAFRKGYIDLTYRKIAEEINVCWRTVATAARRLQESGDLVRARHLDGSYRWWLTLDAKEIVEDPDHSFAIRETPVLPDPHDRSIMGGYDRSIMGGMIDRSWGPADGEPPSKPMPARVEAPSVTLEKKPLKKVFKEIDLKKQQHPAGGELVSATEPPAPKLAVCAAEQVPLGCKTDDESSHKFLIKSLIELGVSQRKARQLCRQNDHDLIRRVLETAPNRPQIKNLPGYIVTEIEDGGYEPVSQTKEKAPGLTTSLGHYAHLTNNKINDNRHRNVKPPSDAPKISPSAQQTRLEQQRLEEQRQRKQEAYENDVRHLISRFKNLPPDEKNGLHEAAQRHLETMLPNVASRSRMATDKTFRKMAMKTVVERFFKLVDDGLPSFQALGSPMLLDCH